MMPILIGWENLTDLGTTNKKLTMAGGTLDTSASEIANYRGNAAAALGGADGGNSGATLIYGETDATGISDSLKAITTLEFQKNKNKYDRELQEKKDLFNQLHSEDAQLPTLLPADRERILKQFRDPIREMLLKNPDIQNNFKEYTKLQQMISDFKEAKAYAGVRLQAVAGLDKAAATETDPFRRNNILKHRNGIYNQDMYELVKPYQEALGFDETIFAKPDAIETSKQDIVGNKIVDTKKSITPLPEFQKKINYDYIQNPDSRQKAKMDVFAQRVDELPYDVKKKVIDDWNGATAKANADHGFTDKDKGYVPPIDFKDFVDEQGNPQLHINATTPQKVLAQSILENYRNSESKTEKVSELPSKIVENNASTQKTLAEAWFKKQEAKKIPSEIAKNYAAANKDNADAAESKEKMTAARDALKSTEAVGDWYINQMLQMFSPKKYENAADPSLFGIKVPGLNGKIVASENGGDQISMLSDVEMTALGLRSKVEGKVSILKPSNVIYNNLSSSDPYFIATYKVPGENGTFTTTTRTIRPNAILENLIKGVVGEETAGKENEDYKTTMRRFKARTGKENINGSIMSLLENADFTPTDTKLDDFMK